MNTTQFVNICRNAHEMNYALSGDGYATAAEMDMHRDDPLAMYELVRDYVVSLTGFDWQYREVVAVEAEDMERARAEVLKAFRYVLAR